MLNKLILRGVIALTLAMSVFTSANAALITQDIISDAYGAVGSITIDTVNVDEFGEVDSWVSFDFFGFEATSASLFIAQIDTMDLYAGILALDFDVTDTCAGCEWAYNGFVEADFGGMVDIFDLTTGDFIFFTDDLSFGSASVVPEPAAILLFLTGLMGLMVRRKKN